MTIQLETFNPYAWMGVPPYSHQTAEEHFRSKVDEFLREATLSGMEDTAAHAMLMYVDVLRQRIDVLAELVTEQRNRIDALEGS